MPSEPKNNPTIQSFGSALNIEMPLSPIRLTPIPAGAEKLQKALDSVASIPALNAIEQMQKSMAQFSERLIIKNFKHIEQWQKSMVPLSRTWLSQTEAMVKAMERISANSITGYVDKLQKQLKLSSVDALIENVDRWQKLVAPAAKLQRQIDNLEKVPQMHLDAAAKLVEQTSRLRLPTLDISRRYAAQLDDALKGMHEHLARLNRMDLSEGLDFLKQFQELSTTVKFDEFDAAQFEFHSNGAISVNGETALEDEVKDALLAFFIPGQDETAYSWNDFKARLEALKSHRLPIRAWIAFIITFLALYAGWKYAELCVLQPRIAAMQALLKEEYTPQVQLRLEKYQSNGNRVPARALKEAIPDQTDKEILQHFRVVMTSTLNVHVTPKANSKILGILHLGQPVRVVESNRHWALVSYTDEQGQIAIQGWVLSRYLSKLH